MGKMSPMKDSKALQDKAVLENDNAAVMDSGIINKSYSTEYIRKSIFVFLGITVILSVICNFLMIWGGKSYQNLIIILMWCPATAAFIVRKMYYSRKKVLGWNVCNIKYIVIGFLIPPIYLFLSYGLYWAITNTYSGNWPQIGWVSIILSIISTLILVAGEEIGWRGFLVPKMKEVWGFKKAVIYSGIIWTVSHLPLMIAGQYNEGTPFWYQIPVFTVEILAINAIMAILRIKSGSVWPAIIVHGIHNFLDQAVMSGLTLTDSSKSLYFVGETGFITALCIVAIAVVMVYKNREAFK